MIYLACAAIALGVLAYVHRQLARTVNVPETLFPRELYWPEDKGWNGRDIQE